MTHYVIWSKIIVDLNEEEFEIQYTAELARSGLARVQLDAEIEQLYLAFDIYHHHFTTVAEGYRLVDEFHAGVYYNDQQVQLYLLGIFGLNLFSDLSDDSIIAPEWVI